MDTVDRTSVLMDGPPARTPERVVAGLALRGHRVILADLAGNLRYDLRAAEDPYWLDPDVIGPNRWPNGAEPPEGCDSDRAVLTVSLCTEADWYEWGRTKIRPQIVERPAYLVWSEA